MIDNGPGIPEAIRDRIFYPLVSGREYGSGFGPTLAQTFVQQHDVMIKVSRCAATKTVGMQKRSLAVM